VWVSRSVKKVGRKLRLFGLGYLEWMYEESLLKLVRDVMVVRIL